MTRFGRGSVVWTAGLVEQAELSIHLRKLGFAGVISQSNGCFGCGHRVGKTAGFGVGGGQSADHSGLLKMSQLAGVFGATHGFGSIPNGGIAAGGEDPGQVIERLGGFCFARQRFAILDHGARAVAGLIKEPRQLDSGIIAGLKAYRPLEMSQRLPISPLAQQQSGELPVGFRIARFEADRGLKMRLGLGQLSQQG